MSAFNKIDAQNSSMLFIAGFQLGFPLALSKINKNAGWAPIRDALSEEFCASADFRVIPENASDKSDETDNTDIMEKIRPETNIPLGWPLRIEYLHFAKIFSINEFCEKRKNSIHTKWDLKSEIWICPTGIVLLVGRICHIDKQKSIPFKELSDIIEEQYAELSYIYTIVASIILNIIEEKKIKKILCRKDDLELLKDCISLLGDPKNVTQEFNYEKIIYQAKNRKLLDKILVDVYYIESNPKEVGKNRIEYVDSTIFNDFLIPIYIVISYSSFLNMRWLTRHLTEQTKILHENILNISSKKYNVAKLYEIKSFRVFCLRLLNEMRPMSIRLKREYMEAMETFWEGSRMGKDVELISNQLEAIENIFEWINATEKQIFENKLNKIVVIITVCSVLAVVAQLISTIDYSTPAWLNHLWRSVLIFGVATVVGSAYVFSQRK